MFTAPAYCVPAGSWQRQQVEPDVSRLRGRIPADGRRPRSRGAQLHLLGADAGLGERGLVSTQLGYRRLDERKVCESRRGQVQRADRQRLAAIDKGAVGLHKRTPLAGVRHKLEFMIAGQAVHVQMRRLDRQTRRRDTASDDLYVRGATIGRIDVCRGIDRIHPLGAHVQVPGGQQTLELLCVVR